MSKTLHISLFRAASKTLADAGRKGTVCLLLAGLFLTLVTARADEPEDVYLRIYTMVQQADTMKANGQSGPALAKYREAHKALVNFQRDYPQWNKQTVTFRLNDLAQKITTLYETAPKPVESPKVRPASEGQAKLLEAGAEPRKVLRLHPKAGDKQTLGMTLKMAMAVKMGEQEVPKMKMPAIKMTLDATVKGVSPEGEISYEMVMSDASVAEDPEVMPQIAEAMKTAFASIKGSSGEGTMSDRGFTKGAEIKAPSGAAPQVNQAMEQMRESFSHLVAALPEEAIGPGAKWEVMMPVKTQGMTIEQTANYELVSIEGDRITVKNTLVQSATDQKIQNPAMPGMKMDVTKMTGTGSGEITFELSKLLPVEGTTDIHSDYSMSLDMGGQKQPMTMKMDLNMRLESK
jgi:hypothetical protein